MNEDDKSLYEQLGKAWLQYVSWREKILAGYLTALGALGYAFSKEASNPVRAGLCASIILVSVVFRILDIRTTGLVNLCQRVGRGLAAGNLYAEIDKYRFAETDKDWVLKKLKKVTTYGFAINMLIAGAIGPSLVGLVIYVRKWHAEYVVRWWSSLIAIAVAYLVFRIAEYCTRRIWETEKDEYEFSDWNQKNAD
ncbi:MAG TPA: hypothetical protein VGR97_08180 [Candidatus Acidoferrales bacterium]|nr:hypothetical protein [Candidatus Acidoferrales bacterium]